MRLLLLAFALSALLLAGGGLFAWRAYESPGPLPASTAVVVPRGSTRDVAAALERESVISAPWQFRVAALLTSGSGMLRAAELEFPAHASLRAVLETLRTGKPIQHKLTVAEGLSAKQVAALIEQMPELAGPAPAIAEGSLLPETYAFERGATRAGLIARMQKAMERALDAAWTTRSPDLPLGSPRDALILASIVERETAKPEERPQVAAVYVNRLRRGMRLQSDPTVVFGVSDGRGVLDHGLTRAELESDTPYNTYRIPGLPPGPICMPSAASIEAATHPADSANLFFVADGTGGHAFARTESEHQRNVAHWRAAERDRARTNP